MYLRCPECKTRYEISAARIPEGGARVRCPRCRSVFQVTRPLNGNGTAPPPARPVQPGAPVDPETARRIARALIGELLNSRREERDRALSEGRLLARLGADILETWDRYRQRVGEPLARDTRFFQDALGEILGDGQPLL